MSLDLDVRKTALVLIDLQKGIVGRPLEPHDTAKVMANAVELGKRFAAAGGTIVPVHVAFASDQADRLSQPVDANPPMPKGGMPADFAELVPEIKALPAQVVITKRQWGAFHGTELDLQLRRRGITTIVLCGIATNFGVESTAREGWQYGYSVVIAEDACSSMGAGMHAFSVEKILPRVGRVRSTAEILASLK